MTPREIARLITEDPDIVLEMMDPQKAKKLAYDAIKDKPGALEVLSDYLQENGWKGSNLESLFRQSRELRREVVQLLADFVGWVVIRPHRAGDNDFYDMVRPIIIKIADGNWDQDEILDLQRRVNDLELEGRMDRLAQLIYVLLQAVLWVNYPPSGFITTAVRQIVNSLDDFSIQAGPAVIGKSLVFALTNKPEITRE